MAYLDPSKFNPALRSKIAQVEARMGELDQLINDVFTIGKLEPAKVTAIKSKIAQFDQILVSNADNVVKDHMKKGPEGVTDIKGILDVVQKRVAEHIAALEADATLKTDAGYTTQMQDVKDHSGLETAKTVERVNDLVKNPDTFRLKTMMKEAKEEYHLSAIKEKSYEKFKSRGKSIADDVKDFEDSFDGAKANSLVTIADAFKTVESSANQSKFVADIRAVVDGITDASIKGFDDSKVKDVINYVKALNKMPILDSDLKTKIGEVLAAVSAKDLGKLRDAMQNIDTSKVKDDSKFDENKKEIRNRVKEKIENGFLTYIPELQKDFLTRIASDEDIGLIIADIAKVRTNPLYKGTKTALDKIEAESNGKTKEAYLAELAAKKAAAAQRFATISEMEHYNDSVERAPEAPKFSLESMGLDEADAKFDYTKPEGDSRTQVDARDVDLADTDAQEMMENVWGSMSASNRAKLTQYAETNLPVPKRGFGEGFRAFFAHLVGRKTYREQEIERQAKEEVKRQIKEQGKNARDAELAAIPERKKNEVAEKAFDEFVADYDKDMIGQAIDQGVSFKRKDAGKAAQNRAINNAASRRETRIMDEGDAR